MPVLVEHDTYQASSLALALGDPATVLVSDVSQVDQALASGQHHLVVLGPGVDLESAGQLAQGLWRTAPGCSVALVRHELTTEVFSYAMSVGIPVVLGSTDEVGLRTAAERARMTWEAVHGAIAQQQAAPEERREGSIVTVFSPKGGVGKTTLSVNLAMALATGGRKVCLVDLDLAFGDVAITLQVIPQHSIDAAIGVGDNLDFALLSTLLTSYDDNVSLLAAPTTPDVKDRVPAALIMQVLTTLKGHFDHVVVDTSPGFQDAVLQALDVTDHLALVCTLDVPTVKNLKMAIDTLNLLHLVPDGRHLVVNRADAEIGLSLSNVEEILGMKVTASLPSESEVAHATNRGVPLVKANPDHKVSRTILGLASAMTGADLNPAPSHAEPARKRRFFGRK